jgi:hypothetical protein
MPRRIWRYREHAIVGLTVTLALLAVLNVYKDGLMTATGLKESKDAIGAAKDILTTAMLILGALFSYFRFFRGRTLAARADVSVEVSIHAAPDSSMLHVVRIAAKNVGSATIWEPRPEVWVTFHRGQRAFDPSDDRAEDHVRLDDWQDLPGGGGPSTVPVIDTGETALFIAHVEVSSNVWAATYAVAIHSASGDIWHAGTTVSNVVSKDA